MVLNLAGYFTICRGLPVKRTNYRDKQTTLIILLTAFFRGRLAVKTRILSPHHTSCIYLGRFASFHISTCAALCLVLRAACGSKCGYHFPQTSQHSQTGKSARACAPTESIISYVVRGTKSCLSCFLVWAHVLIISEALFTPPAPKVCKGWMGCWALPSLQPMELKTTQPTCNTDETAVVS